jgi:hypothetical protein
MSPFITVKGWALSNTDPQELLLTEKTGSEEPVALEYMDYTVGDTGSLNRECNIALEQQSTDLAISEEGISGSGKFFPDREAINAKTGNFKRLVHDQTYRAFYNRYNNPLQIFGIDNIDFPLAKNNRYLANKFLMFTIPRLIFGERITENTVVLYDQNFDDNIIINDDGDGNLVAKENLFSKIQEVRDFGNFIFTGSALVCGISGSNPSDCPSASFSAIIYSASISIDDIATYQNTYGLTIPINIPASGEPLSIWARSADFDVSVTLADTSSTQMETQTGNGLRLTGDTSTTGLIGVQNLVSGTYQVEVSSVYNDFGQFLVYVSPGSKQKALWQGYSPVDSVHIPSSNVIACGDDGTNVMFYDATNEVILQNYNLDTCYGVVYSPVQDKAYVWGANFIDGNFLDTYDNTGSFISRLSLTNVSWNGRMFYDSDKDRIVFYTGNAAPKKVVVFDIATMTEIQVVDVTANLSGSNMFWGTYSSVNQKYYFSQQNFNPYTFTMIVVDANTYAASNTTVVADAVIKYIPQIQRIVCTGPSSSTLEFYNPVTDVVDYSIPVQNTNFILEDATYCDCNNTIIAAINTGNDSSGLMVINNNFTMSNFIATRTTPVHPASSSQYIYSVCYNTTDKLVYTAHGDFETNLLTATAITVPTGTTIYTPTGVPPAAPSNLTISASSSVLSWQDNSLNESRFGIERSTDGVNYSLQYTASHNTTQSIDTNVTSGSSYWYRVYAGNKFGTSSYSNTASVTVSVLAFPPAAPSNFVVAQSGSNTVSMSWTDNAVNETSYSIVRQWGGGTTGSSDGFAISANSTNFADTTYPYPGVDGYSYYQYSVFAANAYGSSSVVFSPLLTVYGPPSAPSSLIVYSGSVHLEWTNNSAINTTNVIERSLDGITYAQYYTASATASAFIDTNVAESNTYWYRLFASGPGGASSYSNTASIEYTASAPIVYNNHLIFDQNAAYPFDTDIAAPTGNFSSSAYIGSFMTCSAINCPALTGIYMENNFVLSSINVSGSTGLVHLNLNNNYTGTPTLSALDVTTNTGLEYLDFGLTHVTSINLTNNTALKYLKAENTNLTSLNLSNNTLLQYVEVHNTSITSLTLPTSSTLTILYCWGNPVTTVDISGCPNLDIIDFSNNALTQAAVDQLLADVVAAGATPTIDNYIDISNYGSGTNAAPSPAGLADIATLQGNGWNVYY